jgi:hypothetical protein
LVGEEGLGVERQEITFSCCGFESARDGIGAFFEATNLEQEGLVCIGEGNFTIGGDTQGELSEQQKWYRQQ